MVNFNNAFNNLAFVINGFIKRALNILKIINMRHHRFHIETPGGDRFYGDRIAVGIAEDGLNRDLTVNFEEIDG